MALFFGSQTIYSSWSCNGPANFQGVFPVMMIKAADVAELMHMEEKTVVRWIRKEGLAAVELNGSYQINRVDLLEWATEHGIKVPPSLFVADEKALDFPTLAEALEAGGVYRGVPGDDKLSVLENLVANLSLPPQVDPEFLLQVEFPQTAGGFRGTGRQTGRDRLHAHQPDGEDPSPFAVQAGLRPAQRRLSLRPAQPMRSCADPGCRTSG